MKIVDVRDGFVKFYSEEEVQISTFVQISDEDKKYVAQILKTDSTGGKYVCFAKILFLYDGELSNYDNSQPLAESEIEPFSFEKLKKYFPADNSIIIGHYLENNLTVTCSKKDLNKEMIIAADSEDVLKSLISNIEKQLKSENVVIIDIDNSLNYDGIVAGKDFKLPLNTFNLDFIYQDCLNDATSESKNQTKEIFDDLSEYSKSVDFVPFIALKTIVDNMVEKEHVFKLLVLKNKLDKMSKLGYFASQKTEVDNLQKSLNQKLSIINLSKLNGIFLNQYIEYIYNQIETKHPDTQIFIKISNDVTKKTLKNILAISKNKTVVIVGSKYRYLPEIHSMFKNCVIEPTFENMNIFTHYRTFLELMPKNNVLVVGECTNYLPLILSISEITEGEISQSDNKGNVLSDLLSEEVVNEEESEVDIAEELEKEGAPLKDEISNAIDEKSDELISKISEQIKEDSLPENTVLFTDEEDVETEEQEFSKEEPVEDSGLDELTDFEISDSELAKNLEIDDSEGDINSLDDEPVIEDVSEITVTDSSEEDTEALDNFPVEDVLDSDENILEDFATEKELSSDEESSDLELTNEDASEEIIEIPNEIIDLTEDDSDNPLEESLALDDSESEASLEAMPSKEQEMIKDVIPLNNETEDFGEIIELSDEDSIDDAILIELNENDLDVDSETLDKEINEDVDKVFQNLNEDSISGNDLDFIDELNNDSDLSELESMADNAEGLDEFETLDDSSSELIQDYSELEEPQEFSGTLEEYNSVVDDTDKEVLQTKNTSTPIVPVYDADIPQEDRVISDSIEQGDFVIHAKYGNGIVEKMIKYGNKSLYSINFDNVGRRLLDPTLTEIKKVSR